MATIYEGTQREQDLVDERIDPEILRALGLSDVSDLDYDEYKTLLKERLAANRMNTSQKAREDSARLDEKILNEFRRVRAETGRFKVRNERLSPQKMLSGTGTGTRTGGRGGAIVPNITFQQQPAQEKEVQAQPEQGLNDFLTNVVAPSLSRIESSLLNILENMTGQQKAEEKAVSKARVQGEKAKKRDKENRLEGLGKMAGNVANVAKKVFNPLADIFAKIFNFLSNVLTGFLVLKVLDWIQNPQNLFIDIGNMFIMFLNSVLRVAHEIAFLPINLFVDGLNNGLNIFENAINDTIGKIPGIPELDLPEVPKPKPIEFPLIPYPKPKEEEPKKQEKTPDVPVNAMSEGGPVNKYYQIMADGGQVRTDTGEKVTGAGPDTQLVALQPGEFVMSKGAVDTFGVDTMMGMNSMGGGNNTPRMAKVQSVGDVKAMQNGGMVGDDQPPQRAEFPNTRKGGADFAKAMKAYKVSISNADPKAQVEPKETVTGKPTGGGSNGSWQPILELIAKHEAVGGSYDSIYPSSKKQGLSSMTIAEADAWQASTANSRGSAAAGRYQFMYIKNQAAAAGIGPNELFSPENQDKMAIALIEGKRGITMDMMKNNPDEAMIRLGKEWASLPMPRAMQGASRMVSAGQSYYAGDGRNKAGATVDEVRRAMGISQTAKPSPPSAPSMPETQSQVSAMPGQTDTQYEKTPSQTDLPMVSPGPITIDDSGMKPPTYGSGPIKIDEMKVSSPVKTPPPPPKKSGGGKVPVLAPKPPGGDSSGTSNSGSTAPMFDPLDTTNPELLVVKAIYNIVG
tara:strand:- start:512 stop:2896 length:2385 start_codon:yes stop_codon:yes gene_type:complete